MKFREMPYQRIDADEAKQRLSGMIEQLGSAGSYEAAKTVFVQWDTYVRHLETEQSLAHIRHTIDTRDPFYDAECVYYSKVGPEIEEYFQRWNVTLLKSPFRPQFEAEYGSLMFLDTEIALKTYSPEIVPQLQEEGNLSLEYQKLLASARIPFEGKTYTLSQMGIFKVDPDDARRKAAFVAEGTWYKENQPRLDEIYDKLVHLRDEMGKKLGYGGYIPLGYYRMGRNCYTREDVEAFRAAVVNCVVPVADRIYRRQAERIGKPYPLSYPDMVLEFRSGNPRPAGDADALIAAGKRFYDALSPETSEFFGTMLDQGLMDLLSTDGKAGGGYCTSLPDYNVPFIFANFNGTQHDVEVITHEAGHAFAAWLNRSRVPMSTVWPSMEACEVHSMSMEFFAESRAEEFFGPDARKFLYSHLAGALTFIPYGTLVDHFQHEVYEHPDMSPRERHDCWKRLLGVYMPWLKVDGEIPFYSDGENWQRQHHIYQRPFYYIDYCLAQTVALEFWSGIRRNVGEAWKRYMAYALQGGRRTFTELLKNAGLDSPFRGETLRQICAEADVFLTQYDLSGIL